MVLARNKIVHNGAMLWEATTNPNRILMEGYEPWTPKEPDQNFVQRFPTYVDGDRVTSTKDLFETNVTKAIAFTEWLADQFDNFLRILIEEVVVDVDESIREIILLIHWAGGRHSELRTKKRETGKHRWCTSLEAVEVVRHMAGRFPDELIAATLNRLGLRTGVGNTWDKQRVYSLRHDRQIPGFNPNDPQPMVTLAEAAKRLQVSAVSIRRMIAEGRFQQVRL